MPRSAAAPQIQWQARIWEPVQLGLPGQETRRKGQGLLRGDWGPVAHPECLGPAKGTREACLCWSWQKAFEGESVGVQTPHRLVCKAGEETDLTYISSYIFFFTLPGPKGRRPEEGEQERLGEGSFHT